MASSSHGNKENGSVMKNDGNGTLVLSLASKEDGGAILCSSSGNGSTFLGWILKNGNVVNDSSSHGDDVMGSLFSNGDVLWRSGEVLHIMALSNGDVGVGNGDSVKNNCDGLAFVIHGVKLMKSLVMVHDAKSDCGHGPSCGTFNDDVYDSSNSHDGVSSHYDEDVSDYRKEEDEMKDAFAMVVTNVVEDASPLAKELGMLSSTPIANGTSMNAPFGVIGDNQSVHILKRGTSPPIVSSSSLSMDDNGGLKGELKVGDGENGSDERGTLGNLRIASRLMEGVSFENSNGFDNLPKSDSCVTIGGKDLPFVTSSSIESSVVDGTSFGNRNLHYKCENNEIRVKHGNKEEISNFASLNKASYMGEFPSLNDNALVMHAPTNLRPNLNGNADVINSNGALNRKELNVNLERGNYGVKNPNGSDLIVSNKEGTNFNREVNVNGFPFVNSANLERNKVDGLDYGKDNINGACNKEGLPYAYSNLNSNFHEEKLDSNHLPLMVSSNM